MKFCNKCRFWGYKEDATLCGSLNRGILFEYAKRKGVWYRCRIPCKRRIYGGRYNTFYPLCDIKNKNHDCPEFKPANFAQKIRNFVSNFGELKNEMQQLWLDAKTRLNGSP